MIHTDIMSQYHPPWCLAQTFLVSPAASLREVQSSSEILMDVQHLSSLEQILYEKSQEADVHLLKSQYVDVLVNLYQKALVHPVYFQQEQIVIPQRALESGHDLNQGYPMILYIFGEDCQGSLHTFHLCLQFPR